MTAALATLTLVTLLIGLVLLAGDVFRETATWTPPPVDDTPGWRILPRQPYDHENEDR